MKPEQVTREGRRILVVDDDPTIVETLDEVLREEGYEVAAYTDPERALAWLRQGARPDVILLDCVMPGITGEQFIEELRRAGIATPIVLFTAARDARHLHAENVVGYIEKPFDIDDLLDELAATPGRARDGEPHSGVRSRRSNGRANRSSPSRG